MWRFCFSITLACSLFSVRAEDWPNWRGPNRNGISSEKVLEQWPDQGPAVLWKGTVGLGFSSVVVGKGKAYTVGHAVGNDTIFCFDAVTGKEVWTHKYASDLGDKYFEGGTTGTPTLEGNRLYWLSRWGDLFCLDAENGKVVWNQKIEKNPLPDWGFTGAPLVHGNLLILNVGEAGMAVDKNTGKTVWESKGDAKAGYTTPLPVKQAVWLANEDSYISLNPADGKEHWRIRWVTQYGVNAADPIPYEDKVFISSGYGKGATLAKPVPGGEAEFIWKNRVLRTQLNAGVLMGKYVYGVDGDTTDKASLKCIEVETGKEHWAEANFGSGGIIVADNKIIALAARGELLLAPVSREGFKPVARAQVLGGKSWTAPVLANGIVYCRNSKGDIVAVDLRKK